MEPMIAFLDRLKSAGFSTCVFSNTNEIATRHIRERFPFYSQFDNYVLSYEEGGMKPDEPIYEVVEQRTGKSGAAILYIDKMVWPSLLVFIALTLCAGFGPLCMFWALWWLTNVGGESKANASGEPPLAE